MPGGKLISSELSLPAGDPQVSVRNQIGPELRMERPKKRQNVGKGQLTRNFTHRCSMSGGYQQLKEEVGFSCGELEGVREVVKKRRER